MAGEDRALRLQRAQFGLGNLEEQAEASSTKWVHVPARETLRVVMLSSTAHQYRGHWDGGRMKICSGPACPLCLMRRGHQDRYAFSVYIPHTQSKAFLEVGPLSVKMMEPAMFEVGALRGLMYDLSHEGRLKNGLVLAEFVGVWPTVGALPRAEDPGEQLARQRQVEVDRSLSQLDRPSVLAVSPAEAGPVPTLSSNGSTPVAVDADHVHSVGR